MDVLLNLRQIAIAFVFGSEYISDAPVKMIKWLSKALILRVVLAVFFCNRESAARSSTPTHARFFYVKVGIKSFAGEKAP